MRRARIQPIYPSSKPQICFPGEGRGPGAQPEWSQAAHSCKNLRCWAPASAGEGLRKGCDGFRRTRSAPPPDAPRANPADMPELETTNLLPRRRPGPSSATGMVAGCAQLQKPSPLGPGLRRGRVKERVRRILPDAIGTPAGCAARESSRYTRARNHKSASPAKAGAQQRNRNGRRLRTVEKPSLLGPGLRRGRVKERVRRIPPDGIGTPAGCAARESSRYTRARNNKSASPAKAGAQQRNRNGRRLRTVAKTFATGPRPPPGKRFYWGEAEDVPYAIGVPASCARARSSLSRSRIVSGTGPSRSTSWNCFWSNFAPRIFCAVSRARIQLRCPSL